MNREQVSIMKEIVYLGARALIGAASLSILVAPGDIYKNTFGAIIIFAWVLIPSGEVLVNLYKNIVAKK